MRFNIIFASLIVKILRSQNALEFSLALYGFLWGVVFTYAGSESGPLEAFTSELGGHAFVGVPVAFFGGIGLLSLLWHWRKGRAYTSLLSAMAWGSIGGLFWVAEPSIASSYVTFWFFALAELVIFIRVWHGFDGLALKDN